MLDQEGMLTQAQLSTRICVPRGTICKYLAALCESGYVDIARKVTYAKPSRSKGMRRGLIYLYARTEKPLPDPDESPPQLSAPELHAFMTTFVQYRST
ncbi:hypothetical protein WJ55_17045 [Burkholderia ubonensis]|nr:hypothetical protein WI83_23605 [Burkholderia ubonensis]KVG74312.1 hypothetical protein WJ34_12845 [Burkholderia ubonensis]KVH24896.1 hypothetical protein WJ37_08060 [Burkholderia ubonensis]KVH51677.1 hypothetical protein WJ38_08160 [Burkholderia ubonensis]KVH86152.1 hypothetical protein WJ43_08520 [Burkholderia ubonensis]